MYSIWIENIFLLQVPNFNSDQTFTLSCAVYRPNNYNPGQDFNPTVLFMIFVELCQICYSFLDILSWFSKVPLAIHFSHFFHVTSD